MITIPNAIRMINRITAHYVKAVEKHPYFCDRFLPYLYISQTDSDTRKDLRELLKSNRAKIATAERNAMVTPEILLLCELAEVYEALSRNDKAAAVDECYDCIAVLLRMVDVLEGRQKLGKPDGEEKGTEK